MAPQRIPGAAALCAAVLACSAIAVTAAGAAPAAASDASATHRYIVADLELVQSAATRIPHGEAILSAVVARVRRECSGAGAGSPQNPESTMMSNEVIGVMITSTLAADLPAMRAYVRAAGRLHWSRPSLNRTIHGYVKNVRTLTELHIPDVCADVRSWAASGFTKLPATTVAFDRRFVPAWVALGEAPRSLRPFETASDRALARVAARRESDLTDFEAREVENWGRIMEAVELNP